MQLKEIGEFGLIDRIKNIVDTSSAELIVGIGDDAPEDIYPVQNTPAVQAVLQRSRIPITLEQARREVAWRMEKAMRDFGADGLSFDTIVAAGPNGAMAHHSPSDTVIQAGQPIVIDMGAKVGGYCSDITRTVVVGEPDDTFRKIYDIVLGAQLTAINTVKAGMTGEECDGLSRSVIDEAGDGDNFGHSLGHGVG